MMNWTAEDHVFQCCGTLEEDGRQYIYDLLLTRYPSANGIFHGKIFQLRLYDDQDAKIAEYDQKWVIGPENGTTAYKLVGKILKEHNRKKGKKRVCDLRSKANGDIIF